MVLLFLLAACGQDSSRDTWLETAQFEERQNNMAHAKQLYEDIVRQYPDSEAATTARVDWKNWRRKTSLNPKIETIWSLYFAGPVAANSL